MNSGVEPATCGVIKQFGADQSGWFGLGDGEAVDEVFGQHQYLAQQQGMAGGNIERARGQVIAQRAAYSCLRHLPAVYRLSHSCGDGGPRTLKG